MIVMVSICHGTRLLLLRFIRAVRSMGLPVDLTGGDKAAADLVSGGQPGCL
jgi:hypothetical protein